MLINTTKSIKFGNDNIIQSLLRMVIHEHYQQIYEVNHPNMIKFNKKEHTGIMFPSMENRTVITNLICYIWYSFGVKANITKYSLLKIMNGPPQMNYLNEENDPSLKSFIT